MTHLYITGTSKGLGEGIARKALENGLSVTGISRNNSIQQAGFQFDSIDLGNREKLMQYAFPDHHPNANQLVLINNAGVIGDISPVGQQQKESIAQLFDVNVVAPAVLTEQFIRQFQDFKGTKMIINISSGAGKVAIDGWSGYCASKAAVDLYTQVAATENQLGRNDVVFYSLAPGIVNTPMQAEIRNADEARFSSHQRFIDYHNNNELVEPHEVAEKVLHLINNHEQFNDTILSVRDY